MLKSKKGRRFFLQYTFIPLSLVFKVNTTRKTGKVHERQSTLEQIIFKIILHYAKIIKFKNKELKYFFSQKTFFVKI